jgi:hypothetical protein
MTAVLTVSPDDIVALSDVDLRELIGRLCEAEVMRAGYSAAAVTWGGDQRSKDGGVDVRVSLPKGLRISGYVSKPDVVLQVKAEDFPRGKIESEMMPTGVIRPIITELANSEARTSSSRQKAPLRIARSKTVSPQWKTALKRQGYKGGSLSISTIDAGLLRG